MSTGSKVIAQTDRHTDRTKTLPLPHTREVTNPRDMMRLHPFWAQKGQKGQKTVFTACVTIQKVYFQ